MTGAEQLTQEVRLEAGLKATREMLTKQLQWRFGSVPAELLERIGQAEQTELTNWSKRFADSHPLDEIFA